MAKTIQQRRRRQDIREDVNLRSLCRAYTNEGVRTLAAIMRDEAQPGMTRAACVKILFDRGWGKPMETHHVDVNEGASLLKVVNEIVHVHETREQIEFADQTPLLELTPEDTQGNGSKKTH
jgi:hypothetical protein